MELEHHYILVYILFETIVFGGASWDCSDFKTCVVAQMDLIVTGSLKFQCKMHIFTQSASSALLLNALIKMTYRFYIYYYLWK